jgi:hypothetical protein
MGGGWLALYAVALGALALFTAYTRNFQGTVLAVARRTDVAASDQVAPRAQTRRTLALIALWPAALFVGLMFFQWWKAVLLVVVAFALLVPLLGALLTPPALSGHYVARIRADLERRLERGEGDAARLRGVLRTLDRLPPRPPPSEPRPN